MSRAIKPPQIRRQRHSSPSFRRLNRAVDNTDRNKRRVIALLAALTLIAALGTTALSVWPLFAS